MNPVLILGKGPTAKQVQAEDHRTICALNGACRLCGRVDWLFVNDMSALGEITESCIEVTEHVVVPSELHLDIRGIGTMSFDELPEWFTYGPALHIYQLPSAKKMRKDIPSFGPIMSVGETCVAWMLRRGYRRFETLGIDPGGGYHEMFAGGKQDLTKPEDWYNRNWERMVERVESYGGTIQRVDK